MQPNSPELWAVARRLVEEYGASLDLDLSFQDFQHEIESLASEYGPPDGCFVLAEQAGTFAGCGGVRRFSESACEMKRLYVVPANRRGGAGRTIAEALIEQARDLDYQRMFVGHPSINDPGGLNPSDVYSSCVDEDVGASTRVQASTNLRERTEHRDTQGSVREFPS